METKLWDTTGIWYWKLHSTNYKELMILYQLITLQNRKSVLLENSNFSSAHHMVDYLIYSSFNSYQHFLTEVQEDLPKPGCSCNIDMSCRPLFPRNTKGRRGGRGRRPCITTYPTHSGKENPSSSVEVALLML